MLALYACSIAGCAHVQPATSWPQLVQRLAPGAPVAVTDAGGTEVRGKVSAVSAASLTLNVGQASRQFDSTDVRRVRRDGDPLWNGLAIGAAIGVLGAALPDNRCSGRPLTCDDKQIAERVTFFAVATAAGIAIDALHRDRTSLYGSPGRLALRVIPTLTPERKSLSIAIGFSRVRRLPANSERRDSLTLPDRPLDRGHPRGRPGRQIPARAPRLRRPPAQRRRDHVGERSRGSLRAGSERL